MPKRVDYLRFHKTELLVKRVGNSEPGRSTANRHNVNPIIHTCFNIARCAEYSVRRKTSAQHLSDWDVYDLSDVFKMWRSYLQTKTSGVSGMRGAMQAAAENMVKIDVIQQNINSLYSITEASLILYTIVPNAQELRSRLENPMTSGAPLSKVEQHSRLRTRRSTSDQYRCMLKPWYISFSVIGWHTWIVEPQGVYANYCSGSCQQTFQDEDFRRHPFGTNHAYMKYSYRQIYSRDRDVYPPAHCVPSQLGAINVIIRGTNSATRVAKKINRMKAEQCMCV